MLVVGKALGRGDWNETLPGLPGACLLGVPSGFGSSLLEPVLFPARPRSVELRDVETPPAWDTVKPTGPIDDEAQIAAGEVVGSGFLFALGKDNRRVAVR